MNLYNIYIRHDIYVLLNISKEILHTGNVFVVNKWAVFNSVYIYNLSAHIMHQAMLQIYVNNNNS